MTVGVLSRGVAKISKEKALKEMSCCGVGTNCRVKNGLGSGHKNAETDGAEPDRGRFTQLAEEGSSAGGGIGVILNT